MSLQKREWFVPTRLSLLYVFKRNRDAALFAFPIRDSRLLNGLFAVPK